MRAAQQATREAERQFPVRSGSQSSERGRKLLDQLELQLEEAAAGAAEDEAAAAPAAGTTVSAFPRRKPVRAPFPAHLPRERVVVPAPKACPCCGGKLAKLGLMPFIRGSSAASSQMISHDRSRPPSETRTISRRGE
jgi:hypothetical protein